MATVELGPRISRRVDAFSTKNQKQAAYATIYEEISYLRNSIRTLEKQIISWKSYHNSLSDCYRLPDEILVEIWKYLAHDARNLTTRWVSITHVCSHWRRLALSCPVLWTWPCIRRPFAAERMLPRAKDLKLTLVLDEQNFKKHQGSLISVQPPANLMRDLASRIFKRAEALIIQFSENPRSVPIGLGSWAHNLFISHTILQIPTNLEYIDITYPEEGPSRIPHFPDSQLLRYIESSPRVKYLLLNGYSPFHPPNFTAQYAPISLTHLRVSFRNKQSAQLSSIVTILKYLKHVPALKNLVLEHVFKPLTEEHIVWCKNVSPPIIFNDLVEVQLRSSALTTGLFLNSISYNPAAFIRLHGLWEEQSTWMSHSNALLEIVRTSTNRITPFISQLLLEEDEINPAWRITCKHAGTLRLERTTTTSGVFLEMPKVPASLDVLTRACLLDNLQVLLYGLSSSHANIWETFGLLDTLRAIYFEPSVHSAFLKTFQSLRHSSKTVFDSLPITANQHPKPSMYFRGLQTIGEPATADPASMRRNFEEYARIWSARSEWKSENMMQESDEE